MQPVMIHDPQHTLTALSITAPQHLRLTFGDGATLALNLAPVIAAHPALQPLADPTLFAQARLDTRGGYVIWIDDELELAADNLRHLATEQAGGIGHERLWQWLHTTGLTQAAAADAIGLSRRMLGYYLSGARPIPKTVWLACVGWQAQQSMALAA